MDLTVVVECVKEVAGCKAMQTLVNHDADVVGSSVFQFVPAEGLVKLVDIGSVVAQ